MKRINKHYTTIKVGNNRNNNNNKGKKDINQKSQQRETDFELLDKLRKFGQETRKNVLAKKSFTTKTNSDSNNNVIEKLQEEKTKILKEKLEKRRKYTYQRISIENIRFGNGIISYTINAGTIHVINIKESREEFNTIKTLLAKDYIPFEVGIDYNGQVKQVNYLPQFKEWIIYKEVLLSKQNVMETKNSIPIATQFISSEAYKYIGKDKTEYLEYLCLNQRKNNKIVLCCEQIINLTVNLIEKAFIFTLTSDNPKRLTIVYENVNTSRATYVFEINKQNKNRVINILYNYFASEETNKREKIVRGSSFKSKTIIKMDRIIHTNFDDWKAKITGVS